jgi:SpoVK/Ycf46/Vps4 family AAA+-type ATPase
MTRINPSKKLLREALNFASRRLANQLSAEQVIAESAKAHPAVLQEGKVSGDNKDTPLEQTLCQYVKNGNTFSPVGKVTLVDTLGNCPFEINMTMAGVVFERVKPHTDEIMIFENSPVNKVVKEIDTFWSRKAEYDKLGLMQNRGIILYGPPGSGKSIGFQQVTEMMAKRGDIVFFVKSPEAIIEGMKAFRQIEPNRKVVIGFEEAEEMCRYNERTMLRLMDGDAKINRVLFLATTNYINKLPERMLRPGRFDVKVYVGPPVYEHRLQYLNHKLKDIEKSQVVIVEMAKKTEGLGFGHLRELIASVYAIGYTVEDALAKLREKPLLDKAEDNYSCQPCVVG